MIWVVRWCVTDAADRWLVAWLEQSSIRTTGRIIFTAASEARVQLIISASEAASWREWLIHLVLCEIIDAYANANANANASLFSIHLHLEYIKHRVPWPWTCLQHWERWRHDSIIMKVSLWFWTIKAKFSWLIKLNSFLTQTVIIAREAHRGMVSAVSAVSAVLRTHGVLCNHISIPIFIHWINFHSCLIQQCSLDYWTVRFI